jgi:thiosulfate/3-mercaptopyruvate sulfurtransferase
MGEAYAGAVSNLIEAGELRERLDDPGLRVVDCRYVLGEPGAGEPLWLAGHIPGASFLDLDRDLAGEPGKRGRHPLPEARDFEAAARRAGIDRGILVVAYDEAGEGGAARLWWLLRHFRHREVRVLNGGLRGWRAAGGELVSGRERMPAGDFRAGEASAGDTARLEELGPGAEALLLDARAPERFRGEVEPVDAVAGHIPGAVSLPSTELAPEGRLPDPGELRARLAAAGATPERRLVAYCGSGVTACNVVLAAAEAGLDAHLYPGSWSEWSRRGQPVERGPSDARQQATRSTSSRSSGPAGRRSR